MAKFELQEGEYTVGDARFAVVAGRFNEGIVQGLLDGALETLSRHGVQNESVTVVRVPGAFEIPLVARRLAASGRYEAILALAVIIRGDTPHFDYVAGECARGVSQVALEEDLPVIFGVVTANTPEQATARAGGAHGNRGREAALAALEMVSLLRQLA